MDLLGFRAALLHAVADVSQDYLATADVDRYVNLALQHVANWAHAADESLFIATQDVDPAGGNRVEVAIAAPLLARSLIRAERTDTEAADTDIELQVGRVTTVRQTGSSKARPYLYLLASNRLVFVDVPTALTARVYYYHAMPDMVATGDTPGQVSGTGIANALPLEYHGAVVSYAATLALTADHVDPSDWQRRFDEQISVLAASLRARAGRREQAEVRR